MVSDIHFFKFTWHQQCCHYYYYYHLFWYPRKRVCSLTRETIPHSHHSLSLNCHHQGHYTLDNSTPCHSPPVRHI